MIRKRILIAAPLLLMLVVSGCGKKQIMADPNAKYNLTELSDKELNPKTYYVKDTTSFYEVYMPSGNAKSSTKVADPSRIAYTIKDDTLIPTMYSDGIIAYPSDDPSLEDITIERFKEYGYSLGVYDAEIDIDGYITFSTDDVIDDTYLAYVLKDAPSKNIRIVSINGETVGEDSINSSGIITGLEENGVYEIAYYAGSYYATATVKADTKFYISYEMYQIDNAKDTKNGYLALSMPAECPSGYYSVNFSGMFKYYNCTKDAVTDGMDMNTAYYTNAADQIKANSQQYVVNVSQATTDVAFLIEYATDTYKDSDIVAILTAPNGEEYSFVPNNGRMYMELMKAISGRWTINIMPQDLEISNIAAESITAADDAMQEEYSMEFAEDTNITINVPYEGDGTVWGTITADDGSAKEFTVDKKQKVLTVTYDYMKAGTYTIEIYHYADTAIGEIYTGAVEDKLTEDVFVIESD